MENGSIHDGQLTSSGQIGDGYFPRECRLNNQGAWIIDLGEISEWIQVEFLNHVKIAGVSTQGYKWSSHDFGYTKTFKVSTSNDGSRFVEYTEHASVKVNWRDLQYYYPEMTSQE